MSPSSSSPVAPVDHVRLDRPPSPRWAPLHTRTRPASRYLNIQCARSSLALIHFTSPSSPNILLLPSSPLQFYLPLSRSQAFPFLCSCPPITIEKKQISVLKNTCTVLFSGIKHTQPLFFSVTIPHRPPSNNPPLCSSSVIKLSSKVIFFSCIHSRELGSLVDSE